MEPHRTAAQLIAESEALLLDFDGPVCDVYAGSDPAQIARDVANQFGIDVHTEDPLDLITHALANNGPIDAIHQVLTATEMEAVRTATETPGLRDIIECYRGPIAVVSNNGADAIDQWLRAADLQAAVAVVVGRNPRCMKPDPRPLRLAADSVNKALKSCVFVGDSMSDIAAGRSAAVPVVALANRPSKRMRFEAAGASCVVDSLAELLTK